MLSDVLNDPQKNSIKFTYQNYQSNRYDIFYGWSGGDVNAKGNYTMFGIVHNNYQYGRGTDPTNYNYLWSKNSSYRFEFSIKEIGSSLSTYQQINEAEWQNLMRELNSTNTTNPTSSTISTNDDSRIQDD